MKVVLKDVRISFCQSIWPGCAEQYQGKGPFRHSAAFLIEPGSANDKAVWAAINAAAAEKWPTKAAAMVEGMKGNSNKFCYQNGDLKDYDGYQGMFSLGSHRKDSDGAPSVVNRNKAPLTPTDGVLFAGCYVNATVDIYAQDGENQGVRSGLMAIQFLRIGDSFGGASKGKADDFEDLGEGNDADFDSLA